MNPYRLVKIATAGVVFLVLVLLTPPWREARGAEVGPQVRLAYLQNDIHHLACWVALEKGLYQNEGVAVEIAGVFRAGPEIMAAFSAGALDMAYVGQAPATTALANGTAAVRAVAQANTEGSAVVVAAADPTAALAGLRGRLVAVPGHSTVQDFLLRKGLVRSGLVQRDVDLIVLKPPEMIGALRTGQVQAFVAWEPYPAQAVAMGVGRRLVPSAAIWPGHPCCVLVAGADFLKRHPGLVKAVVRAHVKATALIQRQPETARAVAARHTGLDPTVVADAMAHVHYRADLNPAGQAEYVAFLQQMGYIRSGDPEALVKGFLFPDFVSMAD